MFIVLETSLRSSVSWEFISEFGVVDGKRGFPFRAFMIGFGAPG